MNEDELSTALMNFLSFQAFDVLILLLAVTWHCVFIMGSGLTGALLILFTLWSLTGWIRNNN